MAGEYEPESTRARLAQSESERHQHARLEAPTNYVEPMVPSVYAEAAWEAKQRAASTHQQAAMAQRSVEAASRLESSAYGHGGILGLGSIEAAQIRSTQAPAKDRLLRTAIPRSDILAILRAQKCINDSHMIPAMREGGDDVLRSLIRVFENLE